MKSKPLFCPKCNGEMFSVEYDYGNSFHHDGTSEYACENSVSHSKHYKPTCDYRVGAFCLESLGEDEKEPIDCKGGSHTGWTEKANRPVSKEKSEGGTPVQAEPTEETAPTSKVEVETEEAVEDPEGEPAEEVEAEPAEEKPEPSPKDEEGANPPDQKAQEQEQSEQNQKDSQKNKRESFWQWLKRMLKKLLKLLKKGLRKLKNMFQKGRNIVRNLFRRKSGNM